MRALNEEKLRPNLCFGCGPENAEGLRIGIFRDGERTDRLVGVFEPRASHGGFPNITHGGLQFTALDCMAGWCMFELRARGAFVPLTKSASMRFLKPALVGTRLSLVATIVREAANPRDSFLVRTELLGADGALLSEGEFEYVTLPQAVFRKAVGIGQMPDSYRRHFGEIP